MIRFRLALGLALVGALLAVGYLFAADTTISQFDTTNQVSRTLKLKDNGDSTYSYATYAFPKWPTGTFLTDEAHAAASSNVATLAAASSKTTYIGGFAVTGLGATSATSVTCAVTDGTWTLKYCVPVPASATTGITPLNVVFNPPLPASAANTAITVTLPSFGTGNTAAQVSAWGYRQ